MEHIDIVRLGLIFAVQAEIEGMKAENEVRKQNKEGMDYGNEDFKLKADELRNISYCHNEQL